MSYNTIMDLLPPLNVEDDANMSEAIQTSAQFLTGCGKSNINRDEIYFLVLIDNHIKALEKAKTMIGKSRFTVKYMGDGSTPPDLWDFGIISLDNGSK